MAFCFNEHYVFNKLQILHKCTFDDICVIALCVLILFMVHYFVFECTGVLEV
jgi:hypothetical protein